MSSEPRQDQIREAVRERYASAAKQVLRQKRSACCSEESASCGCDDGAIGATNYDPTLLKDLPEAASLASLGCGNPTLLAELKEGETVLDLGSGGGIDVLLSARRVGPAGKAYGLDMTDEMLELARANAVKAGATNVEFLKGNIEAIPLPDSSVDVIISNCVINLSPDKDRVLAEAYRVLRPAGRFAVADIVTQGGPLPVAVRQMMSLWAACIAGALSEDEYRAKLAGAGFGNIALEVLKIYTLADVPEEMSRRVPRGISLPAGARIVSAFIRATKAGQAHPVGFSRTLSIGRDGAATQVKLAGAGHRGDAVKSYFKEVASEWDEMRRSYFTEDVRESAIAKAALKPDSVVADVGTGTGFMLAGLCPMVAKAYGFDSSPEMLEVARKNLGSAENAELFVSEGHSLPLPDGTLDATFANMYLHHAPDPAAAIAEMARVLKPGGRLVITDMDSHDHGWMRAEMADVWMGFDRAEVEEWFRTAGLVDVEVEGSGCNCCGASKSGDMSDIGIFVASGTRL